MIIGYEDEVDAIVAHVREIVGDTPLSVAMSAPRRTVNMKHHVTVDQNSDLATFTRKMIAELEKGMLISPLNDAPFSGMGSNPAVALATGGVVRNPSDIVDGPRLVRSAMDDRFVVDENFLMSDRNVIMNRAPWGRHDYEAMLREKEAKERAAITPAPPAQPVAASWAPEHRRGPDPVIAAVKNWWRRRRDDTRGNG